MEPSMLFRVPEALVNIAHFPIFEFGALERLTAVDLTPCAYIARCPSDGLSSPGGRFYLSCFSCGFSCKTALNSEL